ncbi:MAG: hypothetical protein HC923_11695 [Myxococcales bacterium]|nr:hypothetical protein [Myxococcales bacterium]
MAQRYGVAVQAIHLHMLGGVAWMSDMPTRPRHELGIAAAGPLVSIALAALFGVASLVTGASLQGWHPLH